MNHYDYEKAVASFNYYRQELYMLLCLLEQYDRADLLAKKNSYLQLIAHFKALKEELKKEIKILIQYDANMLVCDFLLPSLSVVFIYLQDIGVNRINPNSINKVIQHVKRAYLFMEQHHQKLMEAK
ncbi:hypothetical protein [Sutcliffiella rhizosphaerae]|uniref:Uncharacterized protein n=1 Tax=Sutcliffiella rhizosphaerae TaxID=2880967 RepID=A0ABM8YNX6_9BACI|nr:hypothetical protein [Sutcliffiella rhizosphaerae]CAG9621701.1 hypothetical protein BACCIP111883_02474 [Sutcliffiella rhizosphaerae]